MAPLAPTSTDNSTRTRERSSALRTSRPGSMSALVALTVVLTAELLRIYPSLVVWKAGASGTTAAFGLIAPVFAAAVALVAVRWDPRAVLVAAGLLLAGARSGVQFVDGSERMVLAGVGLGAGLAVLAVLAAMGLPLFGGGLVGGVLLDATLHAAVGTRSLIWVDSGWAAVAVAALVGWYVLLLLARARREVFVLGRSWRAAGSLTLIGPVLVVESFMLANLGWTGETIGVGWLGSALVIGVAAAAGVLAAAWTARSPRGAWVWCATAGGGALMGLALAGAVPGVWWVPAMVLAQAGIGSTLTVAVSRGPGTGGLLPPVAAVIVGYAVLLGAIAVLDGRGLFGVALSPRSLLVLVGAVTIASAWRSRAEVTPRPHRPGRAELSSLCGVFVIPAALLVAGVPILASGTGHGAVAGPGEMRVVTYNVALAFDPDGRLNIASVASVLAEVDADVIGLQEVPRGHLPAGGVDMLGWLQHSLGMPYVAFQPSAPGALHGNAVLSRFPIHEIEAREFARTGTALPRGALAAEIEVPGGDNVVFITAHLPPGGTLGERAERVSAVLDLWQGRERTIVVADLNSQPGSDILLGLTRAGLVSAWDPDSGSGYTYPSVAPRARIDWVLHSADLGATEAQVHAGRASDHLALSALISLD